MKLSFGKRKRFSTSAVGIAVFVVFLVYALVLIVPYFYALNVSLKTDVRKLSEGVEGTQFRKLIRTDDVFKQFVVCGRNVLFRGVLFGDGGIRRRVLRIPGAEVFLCFRSSCDASSHNGKHGEFA